MGPAQAIRTGLAKSFQFSGRASRSEFWWFALIMAPVIGFGSIVLSSVSFSAVESREYAFLLSFVLRSILFIPLLAAVSRRAQDAGVRSGWVEWSFVGIFFAAGLPDLERLTYPEPVTVLRTGIAAMFCLSLALLAYFLTRPSTSTPNSTEVQP
jgi:uncharacterized membrane protein YhaH (DUF805 family)